MEKPPMRMHLRPLMWTLCGFMRLSHRNKIEKINMDGIKPPYLLLCNHNAFADFSVAVPAVFPHRANFVVAIDGFIKREWLLRFIGCICKRKFTNDNTLIWHLRRVAKRGDIIALYPEARYSLCGTSAVLPDDFGKLAKFLKIPVVTLVCHGHHINSPFWNLPDHHLKGTRAEMTCILTAEDVKNRDYKEIGDIIEKSLVYDDFAWQKENGIKINFKNRADGLHKVLYQCPHCGKEYRMLGKGDTLKCLECGKEWFMTELGELSAKEGVTEFPHIPDWYEWERANVRREIENGEYRFNGKVRVDALPNAKGYIDLGDAELTHDLEGFKLCGSYKGEDYTVFLPSEKQYSVHIEYEYLGKFGDCVDLNTVTDTFYVYPYGEDFAVTKFSLATEEMYKYLKEHPKTETANG
ncbi:MAG: hypothetical protein J5793_01375 [Clostridia bacterium]|nr:hypothetical protein [Clostridia bacterium]